MSILLQISDTHFGTEQPHVVEALLQLAHDVKPAVVVVSGDITQRARRAQFEAAREFVSRIASPAMVAIPGNHDIPLFNVFARLFYPYAGFARTFGEDLNPHWQSQDLLVIGVNTTRPSRHKDGEVSRQQIEAVAQRLAAASNGQLRIVVTHQPVHVVRESEIHNRLHGHEAAIRAWSAAGADIIMGGHIHLPFIVPLHDQYPRLPRRCWGVQAGTAVSSRVRRNHPNSVNVIRYSDNECSVERWDYHADVNAFSTVETEHLSPQR